MADCLTHTHTHIVTHTHTAECRSVCCLCVFLIKFITLSHDKHTARPTTLPSPTSLFLSPCLPPSPSPHPLQLSYLSNRKIMGQGRRPQKVQSKGERPTRRRQAREREEGKARGRGAGKTLNFYTHSAAVASCRVCLVCPIIIT